MNLLNRSEVARLVLSAVCEAGIPASAIYGSWAHGDFHFDEVTACTYSDLDLLIPKREFSANSINALNSLLESVISMRVTVRSHNDLSADIDVESDRWITLVSCAASLTKVHLCSHPRYRDYVSAKTLLMLLRKDRGLRYAQIADELGTMAARNALAIKTGSAVTWHNPMYTGFLSAALDEPFRTLFSRITMGGAPLIGTLDRLGAGLNSIADRIPSTLAAHSFAKLDAAKIDMS